MKTQTFLITILFAAFAFTAAAAPAKFHEVNNNDDLRYLIKNTIKLDFSDVNNFLNNHYIDELDESVTVRFMVDSEKKIKIYEVEAENDATVQYLMYILNDKKIDVDESMTGKYYSMPIVLKYKAS
ncbi:MAG: hypothetical protein KA807_12870 [Prolixibacteraceae bacterium]|nr:hypothetical protein [Prolixibacteraceae bacterium]